MTTESGLSEDCDSVLDACGMYAIPDTEGEKTVVFNDADEAMFRVSKSISPADLLAMLRYGERRYKGGLERGKEELAASLRALIGAAGRDDE